MSRGLFITGTDIGVGKTLVTSALLQALGAAGHTTLAMKPVATGCWQTADGLRSEDAENLISAMNQDASCAFEFAIPRRKVACARKRGTKMCKKPLRCAPGKFRNRSSSSTMS